MPLQDLYPRQGVTATTGDNSTNYATTAFVQTALAGYSYTPSLNCGNGSDGDVTISSNTTLSANKQYHNLTVNAGVTLKTGGYLIRCSGTLTLNGTIDNSGGTSGNYGGGAAAGSGFFGSQSKGTPFSDSTAFAAYPGNAGGYSGTPYSGYPSYPSASNSIREFLSNPRTWDNPYLGPGHVFSQFSGGCNGGGGAGGIIVIIAAAVAGSGSVNAIGGNGASGTYIHQAAGGGGVVVVLTKSGSCSWTVSVAGGTVYSNGGSGYSNVVTGLT